MKNLLCGGLERLLGQGYDTLDIYDGLLAERGGEFDHLRADAGVCAGDEHALHRAHALAQDDEGHLLADGTDRLREPADEHGAPGRSGVKVADFAPGAVGDGLGLDLLEGGIAVVGGEGVLGVDRLLLLLALRRLLGLFSLPCVLLLLLLAESVRGGVCRQLIGGGESGGRGRGHRRHRGDGERRVLKRWAELKVQRLPGGVPAVSDCSRA
jgi:hypothetical protein